MALRAAKGPMNSGQPLASLADARSTGRQLGRVRLGWRHIVGRLVITPPLVGRARALIRASTVLARVGRLVGDIFRCLHQEEVSDLFGSVLQEVGAKSRDTDRDVDRGSYQGLTQWVEFHRRIASEHLGPLLWGRRLV